MTHISRLKLHALPQQDIQVLQEKHQHTLYLGLQQERCKDWNPEMEHTKPINNQWIKLTFQRSTRGICISADYGGLYILTSMQHFICIVTL